MSEQHFREIQLSGKQLVFLFMTSVVVAVGVFLLGVSVGRGVRANTGGTLETTEAATVAPPVDLPPPTELTAADTAYHDSLQGTTTPPAEPEPVSEPVDDEEADRVAEAPPAEPTPEVRPAPAPATPPATRPAAATPPASAAATATPAPTTGGWYLQVGAYRSRPNADRQAQDLTAKGFPAAVSAVDAAGLYRVRVGPFADRPEAVRAQTRLRSAEGMASSVTR